MRIISKSKETLTAEELYFLTMAPTTQKMSDIESQIIEVDAWAVFEDVNTQSGEVQEILAIKTPGNEIFATNSKTFRGDFNRMNDLFNSMEQTVKAIKVVGGTSKAGRKFITCVFER